MFLNYEIRLGPLFGTSLRFMSASSELRGRDIFEAAARGLCGALRHFLREDGAAQQKNFAGCMAGRVLGGNFSGAKEMLVVALTCGGTLKMEHTTFMQRTLPAFAMIFEDETPIIFTIFTYPSLTSSPNISHFSEPGAGDRGATALHWAASNRRPESCELLLAAKADVRAIDKDGRGLSVGLGKEMGDVEFFFEMW